MLRKRFTQLGLLLLLSAVTTVAIAAPPPGKGGGGKINASLSVTVTPNSFSESAAGVTGTVTRANSDTSVPLTVTLASSDETEATVSVSVQIPANAVSVDFDVIAIDDTVKDGDKSVTISVSAADHSGASTSITVVDDEGLPPVTYVESTIAFPHPTTVAALNKLTDSGVAVGWYYPNDTQQQAWIYDPLIDPLQAFDPNELTIEGFDSSNWLISSAVGANNNGLIVGYLRQIGDSTIRRGYVLDLFSNPIRMYDLPDSDWSSTWGKEVNDRGDILGGYDSGIYVVNLGLGTGEAYEREVPDLFVGNYNSLNNPMDGLAAEVVGELITGGIFVYSQGVGEFIYSDSSLSAPVNNDFGDVAAVSVVEEEIPLKGKNTTTVRNYFLFRDFDGVTDYIPVDAINVKGINNSGTVLIESDAYDLYHSDYGFLKINSLLAGPSTPAIGHKLMNNTSVHGFSQVAHQIADPETNTRSLLLLTPMDISQ